MTAGIFALARGKTERRKSFQTEQFSFAERSRGGDIGTKREYDTWGSRVITDLSTNQACGCLTSQIGRDVVLSTKYGRTQDTGKCV